MIRTDLALEAREIFGKDEKGVECTEETRCGMNITTMHIKTPESAKRLNKSMGTYITVDMPSLAQSYHQPEEKIKEIGKIIEELLPPSGLVLVAGVGNNDITPDALGPKAMSAVLATRHITGELARQTGLDRLRPTAVIAPGVLGQTGIETGELIFSIAEKISPAAVIVVDALASRRLERLGCTVQVSDTGISPGAGVGNHRLKINKESLGIPVIGIGVPTVVDAVTLASDLLDYPITDSIKRNISPKGQSMVVTPREIDLLIDRAARLIGTAINCALQPEFSVSDILALTV